MIRFLISTALLGGLLAGAAHADPRFASLKLTSEPDSAYVRIDDVPRGRTPVEIPDLGPGEHALHLWKAGFRAYDKTVAFELGKRQVGNVQLAPLTQAELDSSRRADVADERVFPAKYRRGTLKLTTQPESATVIVAGDPAGATPLTVGNVIAGRRQVVIRKDGYRSVTRMVDFKADSTVELALALTPLPAGRCTLQVTSQPESAAVAMDGVPVGTTPLTIDSVKYGKHSLDITKQGYHTGHSDLMVDSPVNKLEVTLAPTATKQPDSSRAHEQAHAAVAESLNALRPRKYRDPLDKPQPPYPALVKARRIEGKVLVAMLADAAGDVVAATVEQSSGDEALDQAAREAALQWKFPPVPVTGNKTVRLFGVKHTFSFSRN